MPCGLFNSSLGYCITILSVVRVYLQNAFLFFYFFEILNFLFPGHGFKMLVGKILSQVAPSEKVTCNILLPSRLSRSKIFPIEQRNDVEASHRACI